MFGADGEAVEMIDLHTFVLVSVAAAILLVGVLAWLVDSGLSDKGKVYVKYSLFALVASLVGLFFLIEDDSEFEYGGWEKQAQQKGNSSRSGGGMGGGGGGGGSASMSGSGGGGGDLALQEDAPPDDAGFGAEEDLGETEVDQGTGPKQDCAMCPEIVTIKPGQGLVGSSNKDAVKGGRIAPASQVTFKREFGIGKYEITVEQFEAFATETGYQPKSACKVGPKKDERGDFRKPGFKQGPSNPVVCVNWKDALAYTEWLTAKTSHTYRLPTELEWEYAARGGVTGAYLAPGEISSEFANFADKKGRRVGGTTPVGSYSANGNEMHDVHGNVWEMTADCWSPGYLSAAGGATSSNVDCSKHVAKGGAWFSGAGHLNFAMRVGVKTAYANNGLGFRVVRESGTPLGRKSSRLSNGFLGGGAAKPGKSETAGDKLTLGKLPTKGLTR